MKLKNYEKMSKCPVWVYMVLTAIFTIGTGYLASTINVNEASLNHGYSTELILKEIGFYVGLFLVQFNMLNLTGIMRTMLYSSERMKLTEKVLHSSMTEMQAINSSKIGPAVEGMVSAKCEIVQGILNVIPQIMPLTVLLYKESQINWVMSLITLVSITSVTTLSLLSNRMFRWSSKIKNKVSIMRGIAGDNFENMKTLKFLKQEQFALNRLDKSQNECNASMIQPSRVVYDQLLGFLSIIPLIANIYLGRHSLWIISLIIISNYTIDNMVYRLTDITTNIINYQTEKELIVGLSGNDVNDNKVIESITMKNVAFDYGKDNIKFWIDSLDFPYHSRTLIHGESGAGKSSLANVLAGGLKPTSGEINKGGNIYYIWQETEMLDDTLWNNIVFNNDENITENEVIGLFGKLNMKKWFSELPNGFNTNIGQKGTKLSSGQKQRVNIIRLVLNMRYHPEYVFICDEITSNLDTTTRNLAIKLIDENCNSTLIAISHNEGFDKICNRSVLVTPEHDFVLE